ncbi:hypothetical protein [Pelagovum sp. HNIBRBA483]|uniref:hypothetical protein n=1 Tax=Pelagovum sp. HNIBRBA483 TaxID=3233341 RepID=UPI0034A4CF22
MQRHLRLVAFFAAAMFVMPNAALAYIGPGMGLGAITAVLGVLAALLMAIIGLVWYPMKRMFKKRTAKAVRDSSSDD